MSKKEQMHFNPEDSGLERSGHLFAKLGSLALLLEDNIQAEAELQTVKNGLDSDLKTVREKWADSLKQAELKQNSINGELSEIYSEIITLVTEGYYAGTSTEEEVIYASGLIHGPNNSRGLFGNSDTNSHFETASQELGLYKSLQIGTPVIYSDQKMGSSRNELLSGRLVEKPTFELQTIEEGDYDPLNPKITLQLNENDRVSDKWYGLKNQLIVGEDDVNDYLAKWAKHNFVTKKSTEDYWATFKKLNELAGLINIAQDNEPVETIKQRLLARVNKEIFLGLYYQGTDLPKNLRNIYTVGGQEKFEEIALLVGKKFSIEHLTEIFSEMLNSNLEEEPGTIKYATKLKAAEMAEKYCN